MLHRIRTRLRGGGQGPWILVAAIAVGAARLAVRHRRRRGQPAARRQAQPERRRERQRCSPRRRSSPTTAPTAPASPTSPTTAAAPSTAAARGAGGTERGNEPCVRASNLADGRAFEFESSGGPEVGVIRSGTPNAAPFTTNATGVATRPERRPGRRQDRRRDRRRRRATLTKFAAVAADTGALSAGRGVSAPVAQRRGHLHGHLRRRRQRLRLQRDGHRRRDASWAFATVEPVDARTLRVRARAGGRRTTRAADRAFHLVATC